MIKILDKSGNVIFKSEDGVYNLPEGDEEVPERLKHRYIDFYSIDFQDVNLQQADLAYANLMNIDLKNANLQHADFYSADLQCADLQDVDLWGANFNQTLLFGAIIGEDQKDDVLRALGIKIKRKT